MNSKVVDQNGKRARSSSFEISKLVQRRINSLNWRNSRGEREEYSLKVGDRMIVVKQEKQGELRGLGTGLNVWNSAIVFSKWLEKNFGNSAHSELWENRTIFEFGSGTGLVGLACAVLLGNAANYILTDQVQITNLTRQNVELNKNLLLNSSKIIVAEYDWGLDIAEFKCPILPPYNIIVVCDCIAPIFPLDKLLKSIIDFSDEQSIILLSWEKRALTDEFWDELKKVCNVEKVPDESLDAMYYDDDMEIFVINKKSTQVYEFVERFKRVCLDVQTVDD